MIDITFSLNFTAIRVFQFLLVSIFKIFDETI